MGKKRRLSDAAVNSHKSEEASLPLSYLAEDIRRRELYPRLPLDILGLLARTSSQHEAETAFPRLLRSAIDAKPESYAKESYAWVDETRLAALAILKRHPDFLFQTGKVTDHFDRRIMGSPYQLFLGAGDVWALKQINEEIIAKIVDKEERTKAEAKAEAAFRAQFPNCPWPFDPSMGEEMLYDARNIEQIEQVKAQLKIIVAMMDDDYCTHGQATKDKTKEAVAELCKIFVPKSGEVIRTGLHFPLGILKEILKVYDEQLVPWSSSQLAYFSLEVIGGAEAALSAVDGQCIKNGVPNFDAEKGPDRRDGLFCNHPKGIPEESMPLVGKLGRTVFVDLYGRAGYSCFTTSIPGQYYWYEKKAIYGPSAEGNWGRLWGYGSPMDILRKTKLKHMGAIMRSCTEKSNAPLGITNQK